MKTKGDVNNVLRIAIDATRACQLGCKYCYFGQKSLEDANVEKVAAAVRNLILAVDWQPERIRISYMGGEPTLAWEKLKSLNVLLRSITMERGVGYSWGMTSNLAGLDREKIEYMKIEGAEILSSIDGPADIQNKNRPFINGDGSFSDVVKNVPLALEISKRKKARITLCPEDSDRIPEIIGTIFGLGFKEVGVLPNVHEKWDKIHVKAWGEGIARSIAIFDSENSKVSTIIGRTPKNKKTTAMLRTCGMGNRLFALSTEGILYPCHRLTTSPEFALIDASLNEPLAIREAIKKSQKIFNISSFEGCHKCEANNKCGSGCIADNAIVNKNPQLPVSTLCLLKKEAVSALKRLRIPYMGGAVEQSSCLIFGCQDYCGNNDYCDSCCDSGSCHNDNCD